MMNVTSHAIVRYVERVIGIDLTLVRRCCSTDGAIVRVLGDEYGLDIDQVKREIATAFVVKCARVLGRDRRLRIPINGGRVVVRDGIVQTVLGVGR